MKAGCRRSRQPCIRLNTGNSATVPDGLPVKRCCRHAPPVNAEALLRGVDPHHASVADPGVRARAAAYACPVSAAGTAPRADPGFRPAGDVAAGDQGCGGVAACDAPVWSEAVAYGVRASPGAGPAVRSAAVRGTGTVAHGDPVSEAGATAGKADPDPACAADPAQDAATADCPDNHDDDDDPVPEAEERRRPVRATPTRRPKDVS